MTELRRAKTSGCGDEVDVPAAAVPAAVAAEEPAAAAEGVTPARLVVCTEDLSMGSMVTCVTDITLGPSRRVRVMETAGFPPAALPPLPALAPATPALEVAIRMLDRARDEGEALAPVPRALVAGRDAVEVAPRDVAPVDVAPAPAAAVAPGKAPVTP